MDEAIPVRGGGLSARTPSFLRIPESDGLKPIDLRMDEIREAEPDGPNQSQRSVWMHASIIKNVKVAGST